MRFLPILCLATTLSAQGIVINEFSYDDTNTDNREFVEIFNDTGGPVDLTGWVLEHRDPIGLNQNFAFPSGTILANGGFWVMGSALVPNVDQIIGTNNILENSNESLTLRDAGNAIQDTLVYEAHAGIWDASLVEGEGLFGSQLSADGHPTSWARLVDAWDTDNNGIDFRLMPETPGASNVMPLLFPYDEPLDGLQLGQPVPQWSGTQFEPVVIDPQTPGPFNQQPIPPSPQGGNAAMFGNPNGNANHAMMMCSPMGYMLFEAWVWIDLSVPGSMWSMGVHGHSDSFFTPPDPLNPLAAPSNGDTGLCWTMVCTAPGMGELFLVDNGDGGTDHIVLGQLPLQQGVNDGWQRLRMECVDEFAECYFGGSYGQLDGQMIAGNIQSKIGGVYVSSFLPGPGLGLVLDHLQLTLPDGFMSHSEFGVPTTVSQPQISVNSFPRPGNLGFEFHAFDLIPNNLGMIVIGLGQAQLPLSLVGGTPGTFLWNSGDLLHAFFSDPFGETSLPLPIPPDPSLAGFELSTQAIDFDTNLPGALPLGHSDALDLAFWGKPSAGIWPAGFLGTNICIYSYQIMRGGRGPCPLGATGTICVNCPGNGCPGPNLKVLVHSDRNVHLCTVKLFRQHGPSCVPQSNCHSTSSRLWNF